MHLVKVAQSCPTLCDPKDYTWNSPGQNSGVGSLSLLQGIFPTEGLNSGPALQVDSLPAEPPAGVGSLSVLQGIFPTKGLNSGVPHRTWIPYQLSQQLEWVAYPFSSTLSWPRNSSRASGIAGRIFSNWATLQPKDMDWLGRSNRYPSFACSILWRWRGAWKISKVLTDSTLEGLSQAHVCTSNFYTTLPDPPRLYVVILHVRLIVLPLRLATVMIFYFFSFGYGLWKLTNIFHYCDYIAITHWIPLSHHRSTGK